MWRRGDERIEMLDRMEDATIVKSGRLFGVVPTAIIVESGVCRKATALAREGAHA